MGQGIIERGSQIDFADSFTIASGQTTSNAVFTHGDSITALIFPAAFTGATVAVYASDSEDGTYYPVHDDEGNAVTITVTAGAYVVTDVLNMYPLNFVQLVSASAEAAERTIVIVSQPV